jgi:glutamine cyclotransferase
MSKKRRSGRKKPGTRRHPGDVAKGRTTPETPASRVRLGRWVAGLALLAIAVAVTVAVPLLGKGDGGDDRDPSGRVPVYGFEVKRAYRHDPNAYTQGLVFDDGFLYEGTGKYGASELRKVELATGKVVRRHRLPARYFGEGIALVGDRIVQLTWQGGVGFVYEKESFRKVREFDYPGEGWGVTHDGKRLILSDGSAELRFLDPESFEEIGRVTVRDRGAPVRDLNELEFVEGEIYANVWQRDAIARISPEDGKVVGWIDLRGLLSNENRTARTEVLNGIAYDPGDHRLFVTGKNWPLLFEIKLVPK